MLHLNQALNGKTHGLRKLEQELDVSRYRMVILNTNKWHKWGVAGILGFSALSLSACSTTSGNIANNAAPITYKLDQGKVQHVAVTQPYTGLTTRPKSTYKYAPVTRPMPLVVAPRVIKPQLAPQSQVVAVPKIKAFDQASVDTDLYKHQRIGKKYTIMGKSYTPKHQPHYNVVGTASWYGDKFHGKLTANGETYDMDGITAAHKTLPLNSMVYVTNVETGKGIMVRINDRGPFIGNRIIDLSREVARRLGYFDTGLAKVRVQYAGPADPMAAKLAKGKKLAKRPSTKQIRKMDKSSQVSEVQKTLPKLLEKKDPIALGSLSPKYKSLRDLGTLTAPALKAELPDLLPEPLSGLVSEPKILMPKMAPSMEAPAQQTAQTPQTQYFPFQPQQDYINPLLGDTSQNPLSQQHAPSHSVQVPQGQAVGQAVGQAAPMTLTIKGPIHMAASRNDKAEFIPAVNYTTIPATK